MKPNSIFVNDSEQNKEVDGKTLRGGYSSAPLIKVVWRSFRLVLNIWWCSLSSITIGSYCWFHFHNNIETIWAKSTSFFVEKSGRHSESIAVWIMQLQISLSWEWFYSWILNVANYKPWVRVVSGIFDITDNDSIGLAKTTYGFLKNLCQSQTLNKIKDEQFSLQLA